MSLKIVTTSWDDGYKESEDIADLLSEYGLQGTFYVPVNAVKEKEIEDANPGTGLLNVEQLRGISENFEVGGHGITHRYLTEMTAERAEEEISGSKKQLEEIIDQEIHGFAYPAGKFNDKILNIVREVGYSYARTVGDGKLNFSQRYEVSVTLFCYDSLVRKVKFSLLAPFSEVYAFGGKWTDSVLKAFEKVKEEGGVLHIAEHPYRLRKEGYKEKLEMVFSKISGHPDINYLDNNSTVERVLGVEEG